MSSEVCTQMAPALDLWVSVAMATLILLSIYISVVVAWGLVRIFKTAALSVFSGWIREHANVSRFRKQAYRFED